MGVSLIGQSGTHVLSRVVEEVKVEAERAQIRHRNMAALTVPATRQTLRTATHTTVQVEYLFHILSYLKQIYFVR